MNYAPSRVYDSPFVQSDWDRGVVTIQKGCRKLALDFTARCAEGSGEMLVDTAVKLLKELHSRSN